MSSIDESRKSFVSLTGFKDDYTISSVIEYYSSVSQILDSFPVSEEKVAALL